MNVKCWIFDPIRLWLGVVALGAAAIGFAGSPMSFGTIKDFTVPEFFDPPHERQMKTLVHGATAEPQGEGRIRLTELRLETFRENGEREMTVEAPECIYNLDQRAASSDGRLTARSGDGRLHIEGTGFLLTLTNKSLTISNNVRTVIRGLGTNPKKP